MITILKYYKKFLITVLILLVLSCFVVVFPEEEDVITLSDMIFFVVSITCFLSRAIMGANKSDTLLIITKCKRKDMRFLKLTFMLLPVFYGGILMIFASINNSMAVTSLGRCTLLYGMFMVAITMIKPTGRGLAYSLIFSDVIVAMAVVYLILGTNMIFSLSLVGISIILMAVAVIKTMFYSKNAVYA